MKIPKGKKLLRIASAGVLATSSLASLGFASIAHAANLNHVEVVFNNMQTSANTAGTVCFTTVAAVSTSAKIDVTFPAGFVVSTTAASWAVNATTNATWPSGAAALTSIAAPTGTITSPDVIFTSGALTATTYYCFNWTSTTVTEPTTAGPSEVGTVATQTSTGTAVDSGQFATATLTNDTVSVTATVPPLFDFGVAPNSDPLGTLSTGSVKKSASANRAVLTVNTNAENGWQVWAKDANGGLASAQAGHTIASSTGTLTAGTEGFTTGVQAQAQVGGAGTVTLGSGWSDTGDNGTGVALSSSAFKSVATSTGPAQNSTLTMANSVAISTVTPAAADYTDTETYIAAGLF